MNIYKGYKITLPVKFSKIHWRCYVKDQDQIKVFSAAGETKEAAVKNAKQFIKKYLAK
jgi:predicted RNase H-like HicB family nuclease